MSCEVLQYLGNFGVLLRFFFSTGLDFRLKLQAWWPVSKDNPHQSAAHVRMQLKRLVLFRKQWWPCQPKIKRSVTRLSSSFTYGVHLQSSHPPETWQESSCSGCRAEVGQSGRCLKSAWFLLLLLATFQCHVWNNSASRAVWKLKMTSYMLGSFSRGSRMSNNVADKPFQTVNSKL